MYRTALISSAIVAGCLIGGCSQKEGSSSSGNQSTPPAVTTPANAGAKTAAEGAKNAETNNDQAKISAAFTKVEDDLKAMKIDDAKSDLKTLDDMKGSMSAEDQQKLQTLTTQVDAAHAGAATPALPH